MSEGSNEIFRLPMRGYFSTDGGATWGGVDLPLPWPKGNGLNFGSDPSLAFDTVGHVYYSYRWHIPRTALLLVDGSDRLR